MTQKFNGPFRVIGIVGKQAYRVALPKQYSRLYNVFYVSLLELWNERDSGGQRANLANPVPLQLDENAALEYEVESIVYARTRKGKREYLVKWKDWDNEYNTWELEENIEGSEELVSQFNRDSGSKRRKRM
jgi:hypothetical protein